MNSTITATPLLKLGFAVDGVGSISMGIALCLFADSLGAMFAIAPSWLFGVGVVCLLYGPLVGALSLRPRLPSALVLGIVIGNTLWVLASLLLAVDGIGASAAGIGFILTQAAAVAGFVVLQALGWRQSRPLLQFAQATPR
jgi:hypothetical protein